MQKHIGIVGSGFAGAVLANELARSGKYRVSVLEERSHAAGNCHTSRDPASGILIHQYGPHIFHTNRKDVWEYLNRLATFGIFTNRVKAITTRGIFSLPLNLLTINQFFKKTLNPSQARNFIASLGDTSISEPKNFEEQALKFLGRELYEAFFYGYTKKQWGVDPKELPASILQRLPIRFNYDDNYYSSPYQGIPLQGYTPIIEKLLDHSEIDVHLNRRFTKELKSEFDHVFYSGPLDAYFDYRLGRLRYRSLIFERFEESGDFQGNAVINYCDQTIPFTRITEHKHFAPWEEHEKTICFREFSKETEPGETPYYPLRLSQDKSLLSNYLQLAGEEKHVTFIGRLGTYRYLDMHVVIGESLDLAKHCLATEDGMHSWPLFSHEPM